MSQYIKEEDGTWTKVGGMEKPLEEYSTTETVVGKWIDGKPIYRKVIDFGYLPNGTTKSKTIPHGISNISKVTNLYGMTSLNDTSFLHIPSADPDNLTGCIYIRATTTEIGIAVGLDRSTLKAIVIIEYTKTTDD